MTLRISLLLLLLVTKTFATPSDEILIEAERDNSSSSINIYNNHNESNQSNFNLKQILSSSSGLDFINSNGVNATLFYRGGESHHLLVILDNVIVNDPTAPANGFDFSKINYDDIESIQLLSGAESLKYGPKAFLGVLVIKTKNRTKIGREFLIHEHIGSYQTFDSLLSFESKPTNNFSYHLSVNRQDKTLDSIAKSKTATTPEKDRIKKDIINISSKINHNTDFLQFNFKTIDTYEESDGGSFIDDPDFTVKEKSYLINGEYLKEWSESFNQNLSFSSQTTTKKFNNPDPNATYSYFDKYNGNNQLVKLDNNYTLKNHFFDIGGSYGHEDLKINSNQSTNILSPTYMDSYGIFFAASSKITTNLNLEYSTNLTNIKTKSITKKSTENYSISPSYKLTSIPIKLFSNHSINEKFPSLYQLKAPIFGNNDLKTENLIKHDVGIESIYYKEYKIRVTNFYNRYKNLIDYDFNSSKYLNINSANIYGLELQNVISNNTINFISNLTLQKSSNQNNKELPRRPQFKTNHSLETIHSQNLSTLVTFQYVGSRINSTQDNLVLNPYSTIDAKANYQINSKIKTSLSLNNILNKSYEEISGYNTEKRSIYLDLICLWD